MDNNITLETLAGGALAEQFDEEMKKVLENINDPNTDPNAKRSITIKVTLKPDDARNMANIDASCKSSLAPYKSIGTMAALGKVEGEFVAQEFSRHAMQGQRTVDEVEKENGNIKPINIKNAQSK
ncbi:hypothetical protein QBE53_05980 [Vallitaleaceae bacterium 9-2]